MKSTKLSKQFRRQQQIRSKVAGNSLRPRLAVFRSNKYIYAQLIDDTTGNTIITVSNQSVNDIKMTKTESAQKVGEKIANLAISKKIDSVVFDRRGYRYHGRVKAIAEGARKGGLKF